MSIYHHNTALFCATLSKASFKSTLPASPVTEAESRLLHLPY